MKGTFDTGTGVGKQKETTKWGVLQLVGFHQNQDILSGCCQCFFSTWKQLNSGTETAFYSSVCLLVRVLLTLLPHHYDTVHRNAGLGFTDHIISQLNLGFIIGQS